MDGTGISKASRIFDADHCLVCSTLLEKNKGNISKEHIFPKWLMNKFSLHKETIFLLNGTRINYSDLTIPCCKRCNNEHLSTIESIVSSAFSQGHANFYEIDRQLLTIWLIKIYLGLLRKETTLSHDRTAAHSEKILTSDDMLPYRILQAVLKGASKPLNFQCNYSDVPASLFIYKIKDGYGPDFTYYDTWSSMCLMLKLGNIGLLAIFDMGAISNSYRHIFLEYEKYELHHLQFIELVARAVERSIAYRHSPYCSITDTSNNLTVTVESSYLSRAHSEFDDYSCEVLASAYDALGYPKTFNVQNWNMTTLADKNGEFRILDERDLVTKAF